MEELEIAKVYGQPIGCTTWLSIRTTNSEPVIGVLTTGSCPIIGLSNLNVCQLSATMVVASSSIRITWMCIEGVLMPNLVLFLVNIEIFAPLMREL